MISAMSIVVIASLLLAGWCLLLPEQVRRSGKVRHGLGRLAMRLPFLAKYQRIFRQYGVNALLHTWSLGVEEQFYLIMPLFLSCYRFPLRLGDACCFPS